MSDIKTVGIIGAGKLGVTIAQLALAAGYEVFIAGSGNPDDIALSTKIITPGAVAVTTADAVARADIVVLAMPLGKFRTLERDLLKDKLVIDGMNHWYEVDGPLEEIIPHGSTTSDAVQQYFSNATIIKALNHMGYHHLRDEAKDRGAPGRKAIAVAGDEAAAQKVSYFVDTLGFDPLYIGVLHKSKVLETGRPGFGANVGRDELEKIIAATQ